MTETLRLRVWSPSETLLDIDQLSKIIAVLPDGEIGIFPNHTRLLAETIDGQIRYTESNDEMHQIDLFGGILKIEDNQVLIFTGGIRKANADLLTMVQADEDVRFDRLARQLMKVLNLEPG